MGAAEGGPSPRGRGKRARTASSSATSGSIPAWAGETKPNGQSGAIGTVHPRVGGGNSLRTEAVKLATGPSPRGRGKLSPYRCRPSTGGSIPAWAGETASDQCRHRGRQVHPRVGGGNFAKIAKATDLSGPSPRGRGKPSRRRGLARRGGSIPAWAGETLRWRPRRARQRVHPRVGGGNITNDGNGDPYGGPSPRGRGKHGEARRSAARRGSIPAWAGETDDGQRGAGAYRVHPRVGGGNRVTCWRVSPMAGPSPRGRGKRQRRGATRLRAGSIPAWAGETANRSRCANASWVHPRVGGGNRSACRDRRRR